MFAEATPAINGLGKEIISVDLETGDQEFVVVDMIGVRNRKFVFVLEAKSAVGEAMRQCSQTLLGCWFYRRRYIVTGINRYRRYHGERR